MLYMLEIVQSMMSSMYSVIYNLKTLSHRYVSQRLRSTHVYYIPLMTRSGTTTICLVTFDATMSLCGIPHNKYTILRMKHLQGVGSIGERSRSNMTCSTKCSFKKIPPYIQICPTYQCIHNNQRFIHINDN